MRFEKKVDVITFTIMSLLMIAISLGGLVLRPILTKEFDGALFFLSILFGMGGVSLLYLVISMIKEEREWTLQKKRIQKKEDTYLNNKKGNSSVEQSKNGSGIKKKISGNDFKNKIKVTKKNKLKITAEVFWDTLSKIDENDPNIKDKIRNLKKISSIFPSDHYCISIIHRYWGDYYYSQKKIKKAKAEYKKAKSIIRNLYVNNNADKSLFKKFVEVTSKSHKTSLDYDEMITLCEKNNNSTTTEPS